MELNYSLSSHSSSLEEGKKKPPKKVGQATVGNSHTFAQQKKQALDNNRSSSAAASLFEQSDYNILGLIKLDIGHLSNCCSKGKRLSGGCLLSCFGYYQHKKSPATTSTAAAAACDQQQSNSNQPTHRVHESRHYRVSEVLFGSFTQVIYLLTNSAF